MKSPVGRPYVAVTDEPVPDEDVEEEITVSSAPDHGDVDEDHSQVDEDHIHDIESHEQSALPEDDKEPLDEELAVRTEPEVQPEVHDHAEQQPELLEADDKQLVAEDQRDDDVEPKIHENKQHSTNPEPKLEPSSSKPLKLEAEVTMLLPDADSAVGPAADSETYVKASPPPPSISPPTAPPPPLAQSSSPPPPVSSVSVLRKPKSYDPADHQLTPELVKKHLRDNVVMVTWANNHYYDFVNNWVYNVKKLGITNFMVGAMDTELLKKLVDDDIPTFAMQSGLTVNDFGWGSPNFHKMGRKKIDLIRDFTLMGFDILVSDVDTVWMRDPIPYMNKHPAADILTSSDHLSTSAPKGELEHPTKAQSPANIGIMLIRHTAKVLAKEWVEVLKGNDQYWDQNAFNDLVRKGSKRGMNDVGADRLFLGYHGKLKVGILPVGMFCSGHTYFVQKMHLKHKLLPYVVHATFQFSGTEGKRHRMREAQLWVDPPHYYNRTNGYLVYDPLLPPDLGAKSGSVEGHFALVNHQLLQVRAGLQLAQSLGRALIMPKLMCGFDRWWAPHRGKIPGSDMELPFECPMDHVFEVETWLKDRDELAFGPRIDFREHSFLSNPHTPPSVLQSRLQVALCQPGPHTDASKADTKCLTASQLAKEPTVRQTLNPKP